MNRFALLDPDNDDEHVKGNSAPADKKKKTEVKPQTAPAPVAASTKPAAAGAPKKTGDKPKNENKKPQNGNNKPPGPKPDRPQKPKSAPSGEVTTAPTVGESEVVGESGSGKGGAEQKRDQRSHGRGPRTRFEKRQDESNPHVKPNNRIRGSAHGNTKRRPSKNSGKDEVDGIAKDAEKHPENVEVPAEQVEAEAPASEEVPEVVEAPPEPKTLTLDEFNRKREEARAQSAILASSKATRPVEELTGLKIKEDELSSGLVYAGVSKSKASKSAQRSNGKTLVTDLGFKLEEEPQPREERRDGGDRRGGRGGGRSGRGGNRPSSGGNRPSSGRGVRVDIADETAFPSL